MYGAIFGDIIGSRFEFDRGGKTKKFKLFTREDSFTDDTAMTIAVADGLLRVEKDAGLDEIRRSVTESMRDWGHRYPNAGYGGRFYEWLFFSKNPKPYGSYGNGSAMRVSAAGWLYDSLERTREVARTTADVTHNHPEGIKGAECTAAVIYMSRTGSSKDEIQEYVAKEFGYDMRRTVDELRPLHEHVESCQDSLPKALASFLEGDSYEDVVRNAVSLGGDTDTLAAIAGSMAEAFYGIPLMIMAEGQTYLPDDMLEVLHIFDIAIGRKSAGEEDIYEENGYIKAAVETYYETHAEEDLLKLLAVIMKRIQADGQAPTPMVDVNNVSGTIDPEKIVVGQTMQLDQEVRLKVDTMMDGDGNQWIPLFTDYDEMEKKPVVNVTMNVEILRLLEFGLHGDDVQGVIINPYGQSMSLPKSIIKIILDHYKEA